MIHDYRFYRQRDWLDCLDRIYAQAGWSGICLLGAAVSAFGPALLGIDPPHDVGCAVANPVGMRNEEETFPLRSPCNGGYFKKGSFSPLGKKSLRFVDESTEHRGECHKASIRLARTRKQELHNLVPSYPPQLISRSAYPSIRPPQGMPLVPGPGSPPSGIRLRPV